jgi:hypothetical protein
VVAWIDEDFANPPQGDRSGALHDDEQAEQDAKESQMAVVDGCR